MALQLINCPDYQLKTHHHSYLSSTIILILSLFMVLPGTVVRAGDPAVPILHGRPPTLHRSVS